MLPSIAGIWLNGTNGGINFYHNSVYLGSGSFAGNTSGTRSAAIYFPSTTTSIDLRDNIFATNLVNSNAAAAKAYAIYSDAAASAFSNINNNDYFATGTQGVLGFIGAADRTTLAAWQTATGQDAASISADPVFVSSTDLHISLCVTSPVNDAGVAIGAVTTDYDGQARSGSTPDIGADEFTPAIPCNDGNDCTGDVCVPTTGCVYVNASPGTE